MQQWNPDEIDFSGGGGGGGGDMPSEMGGTMADWSGDTAPAGAGGDPYADAPPDTSTPETADMGLSPGGTDAQLTPFSPGGGFDFTNVLQGVSRAFAPQPQFRTADWQIGGGLQYRGGAGLRPPQPGGPNLGVMSAAQQVGTIVRYIAKSTGLRVSAKSIVGLIVKYGFPAAAALFRVDVGTLLPVFMQAKAVRHHRRGPGLYTVAKKLRRADRLRHTVAKLLGPALHARARRAPRGRGSHPAGCYCIGCRGRK